MKPLRLKTIIQREIELLGGAKTLESRIEDANRRAGLSVRISRKTLNKLAYKTARVHLSWPMMVALDTYLSPKGEGLDDQPILEKLGILHCVANPKKKVIFLVGAKPRPRARRCDLSPWDMRSTARIVQELGSINPHVQHEIVDVLLRTHQSEAGLHTEPWYDLLEQGNQMLVSIGSPIACVTTEIMLARMFNKDPYRPPATLKDNLPFCFIWPPKHCGNLRSCFALPGQDLPNKRPALRRTVLKNQANAFWYDKQYFKVPVGGNRWVAYSIIAAQRRKLGQVWVVIAGQSGPATFAAATKLNEITESLPWTAGQDGPVLWAVVEVKIEAVPHGRSRGDDRTIKSARLLGPPNIWKGDDLTNPSQDSNPPAAGR